VALDLLPECVADLCVQRHPRCTAELPRRPGVIRVSGAMDPSTVIPHLLSRRLEPPTASSIVPIGPRGLTTWPTSPYLSYVQLVRTRGSGSHGPPVARVLRTSPPCGPHRRPVRGLSRSPAA
jgi:hypothetical protein